MGYKNKTMIGIIILIMFIPMISSEESFTFQKDSLFTIELRMADANLTDCSICSCDISLFYPNGSAFVRKAQGININSFCQYSNRSSVLGIHGAEVSFNNSVDNGKATFEFEITTSGNSLQTSESIIYIIFLIAIIFAFCLCLYGAIVIPFKDTVNPETLNVVSVNDMKYLKIFCIFFSYVLLLFIFGITRSIMENYLFINGAYKIFNLLYQFMFAFIVPFIIISILFVIFWLVDGKKTRNAIRRGVPLR